MSIYTNILTGGSNNHETTSENANQIATDFISEGVVGSITNTGGVAPATGALAVNAQGTPDMTVAVSAGVAYVTATPSGQASQSLRVYNNASANVTIAANSSGSTKYDWIYLSVSAANAANPNSAGDNVTTLVASRSSSASSDDGTPPTYGYPIAVVTVANAASSITNGNITDIRARTGAESNKLVTGADAAYVATGETTTSTSFTDLTTTTDTITVMVGANGLLYVSIACLLQNSGANFSSMSFALTGANTLAADVDHSIAIASTARLSGTYLLEGLTPGRTVVKAKYNVSAGTGTFTNRRISAIPL